MPTNAIQERRRRVFTAWTKGATQLALAAQEGVHQSQISRDIAAVCATLAPVDWQDVDRNKQELLGRIAFAESELLAAWERSKQPKRRHREKQSQGRGRSGKGLHADVESVTEGRDGNSRFIERLESLWTLRAKLTGAIQNTITLELAEQLAALEQRARELGHDV